MKCPSCTNNPLLPRKLEYGLPALSCGGCGGYLIELLSYRMWRDVNRPRVDMNAAAADAARDSKAVISCPKCQSFMVKYGIKEGVDNKLDLCASCGVVWLDGGEWELLDRLDLTDQVPNILAAPWQTSIKRKAIAAEVESRYKAELGDADFAKVLEFKKWLGEHTKSDLIWTLLRREK